MNPINNKLKSTWLVLSLITCQLAHAQYFGGSGQGNVVGVSSTETMSNFWRGTVSTFSDSPSNWTRNSVPATGEDIIFDAEATNHLTADGSKTIGSIDFSGSGKNLILGSFDITINGTVNGAGSSSYFKTSGTGTLKRSIVNGTSFTFPVGNSAYNPVRITNNTGSADDFSVRVDDAVYVNGLSGTQVTPPRVNRTWQIGKTNANAGSGINLAFQWNTEEEAAGIATFKLNHHNGTQWLFASGSGGSEVVSGTGPKTLTFTGYLGSFSPFYIGSSNSPLPVQLLRFTAIPRQQQVAIHWETSSELNSRHFDVERSANGVDFTSICRVAAAGNSHSLLRYGWVDPAPLKGRSFYRLRQEDLDGRFEYSQVIPVVFQSVTAATIMPNPTTGPLTVQIPADWRGEYELRLLDIRGRVVMQQPALGSGSRNLSLDHLPAGVYQLGLWQNGQCRQQGPVLIQK